MKYAAALIILICALASGFYFKGCITPKPKAPDTQITDRLYDTIKYYKDALGTQHAQVQIDANTHAAIVSMYKNELDSIAKRDHEKNKQINSYEKMVANLQGKITTPLIPVIIHDTINGQVSTVEGKMFSWQDDYFRIMGTVDSQNVSLIYSATLPFTTTTYWKRKHHLLNIGWGRKIYYLDASCSNPNVEIINLKGVKIN